MGMTLRPGNYDGGHMTERDLTAFTDDLARAFRVRLHLVGWTDDRGVAVVNESQAVAAFMELAPWLARIVADAEQRGRDEVRARVEAALRSSWADVKTHGDAARKLRAALTAPEPDA